MIDCLHIHNFKCFEDQSIPFGRLTLLSGLNGMGKSTVLQALLLLRQSHEQGLLGQDALALNGDLTRIGKARDALFEGAREENIGFGLVFEDGNNVEWRFKYDRDAEVLNLDSASPDPKVFETSLFSDRFHYLCAERIGPRASYETSDIMVRRRAQLGTRGEYTAHFLATHGSEKIPNEALAHPASTSRQIVHQVEAWLGEVSPGTRLNCTQYVEMDLVSLEYSFVAGKQVSNRYRSTNVGFGMTYTLPILAAILSSGPGTLLLVENPEAHLHPKGQVRIAGLLAQAANCGLQVVVETHSDHVLNGIRLGVHAGRIRQEDVRLHFFQRGEEEGLAPVKVVTPRMDSRGRIDRWPDAFFDEWDKSLEALLESGDA